MHHPKVLTEDHVRTLNGFDPHSSTLTVKGHSIAAPHGRMVDISSGSFYTDWATITGSNNVLAISSGAGTAADLHDLATVTSLAWMHFPNTMGGSFFTNTLVVYNGTDANADAGIYDIEVMGSGGKVWQVQLVGVLHHVGADSLGAANFS